MTRFFLTEDIDYTGRAAGQLARRLEQLPGVIEPRIYETYIAVQWTSDKVVSTIIEIVTAFVKEHFALSELPFEEIHSIDELASLRGRINQPLRWVLGFG